MLSNAIGIDVGGTGIKAAIVDIRTGELLTERLRVETPAGGEPKDIAAACNGLLNDADAAGVAEMKFGAGRKAKGVTIMTTLGTGIGSALFLNKKLVPNTELGHLDIGAIRDFEQYASFAQMEAEGLSFEQWAERLEIFYAHLERLFSPDLFIVGTTRNAAGIIGAAAMAAKVLK